MRSLDLQSENGISHVSHYEDCHAALKACVRQHPQWLMDKINNLELNFQFFPELGYLISSLDHPLAVKIWFKNKAMLLEKMPKDRRRSLVYCISRFNDISEINFLTNCLVEKSDYVDGAALAALAKLDPDALLKNIDAGVGFGFVLFCNQWVPDLLHVRPEATRRKLLELAMTDKEKSRILKQALLKYVDEFDIPLLEFFLENFKNKINDNLIDACNGDSMWISVYLSFFNKITKLELLDFMIRYSVVGLEGALVRVAVERIGRFEGGHDYVLEDIRLFLIRLAGYGISELILAELSSDFFRRRYAGLEAAAIGGDVVISVLEKIAGNKVAWSADGTTASEAMRENYHAMVALALLGAREKIIDAIWLSGYPALPIDFMSLLGGARPVPKVMIQRAFEVFANIKNAERGEIVCALAVAWVSADTDFIIPIRNSLKYPELLSVGFVYVCMALQELGDDSDDFMHYANNLLRDEKTRAYGCRALLSIPEKGIKYLMLYLESIPFERWQPFDVEVVRSIFKFERSRDFALRISIKYCLELPDAIFLPLDVVCEDNFPEIRDLIVEIAFRLDYISTSKTMSAIKALVKIAPDRATDAILKHLRKSENSECELCALFVRINPENAVEVFLNLIIDLDRSGAKRENIRAAAGRAIRWLEKDLIDVKLVGFFESSDRKERAIAVDLAGWLPPYRLDAQLEVLIRDENEDLVRGSFFDAMRRRNSEKNLYVLYDDFELAETKMRWALLYTIMQAGDPILLADKNDPLWIGGILGGAPCMYMRYADAEIGRKIKKIP